MDELTDGGEGGLRNVCVCYGPIIASDEPVEGEADVFAIPLVLM